MGGNLFGIGLGELLFLAIMVLIVFGPERIPEIARSVGKLIRQFRAATAGVEQEVRQWMQDAEHPEAWLGMSPQDRSPFGEGDRPALPLSGERGQIPRGWLGAPPASPPVQAESPVADDAPAAESDAAAPEDEEER